MEELFNDIMTWPLADSYLLFKKLQMEMKKQTSNILRCLDNANDIGRVKQLLTWKKESAIIELRSLLAFVAPEKEDVKIVYLRILPVFFSYVTLYDMEVASATRILHTLRILAAFENYQNIFEQWSVVFQRRSFSKKPFSYKDETCVRDLPTVTPVVGVDSYVNEFELCIGYNDVHLLRNFHRWLRTLRLHKYLFFFANLSYEQIMGLTEENFDEYKKTFNIVEITIGAKNKILREVDRLRQRRQNLESILSMSLTTTSDLEKIIRDIKRILRSPIPSKDVLGEDLPQWLVVAICKVFDSVLTDLDMEETAIPVYGLLISLLKEAWNYNIFTSEHKSRFNEWRTRLSDNMKSWNVEEKRTTKNESQRVSRNSTLTAALKQPVPSSFLPITPFESNDFCFPSIGNFMIDPYLSHDGQSVSRNSFPFNQYTDPFDPALRQCLDQFANCRLE